jgi:hypothetical protein
LDLRPIGPLIPKNKKGLNIFAHYNQSFFGDEFSTLGDPPKNKNYHRFIVFLKKKFKILKNFWKKMLQILVLKIFSKHLLSLFYCLDNFLEGCYHLGQNLF